MTRFEMAIASSERVLPQPKLASVIPTEAPSRVKFESRKTFDCCGGFTPNSRDVAKRLSRNLIRTFFGWSQGYPKKVRVDGELSINRSFDAGFRKQGSSDG